MPDGFRKPPFGNVDGKRTTRGNACLDKALHPIKPVKQIAAEAGGEGRSGVLCNIADAFQPEPRQGQGQAILDAEGCEGERGYRHSLATLRQNTALAKKG